MRKPDTLLRILCVISIGMITAVGHFGQNSDDKGYADNGISFDYKSDWELVAEPTTDSQKITLSSKNADAQILIIVLRKRSESKDPMTDLNKQTIEPWLASLIAMYTGIGMPVQRTSISSDIAGQAAEGAKLAFFLDDIGGTGEAYWAMLDRRLVLTYFIRPDKMAAKANVGWDTIRKSLKVERVGKK
jgi:hypothetical protein